MILKRVNQTVFKSDGLTVGRGLGKVSPVDVFFYSPKRQETKRYRKEVYYVLLTFRFSFDSPSMFP